MSSPRAGLRPGTARAAPAQRRAAPPRPAVSGPDIPPDIPPDIAPDIPPAGPRLKAPKAATAAACQRLEQLPNIGPAMAADLRGLGIAHPQQLASADAFVLYQALCRASGKRQDPCVLDTFLAATDFMRGAAPAPWWAYTARRKLQYPEV